MRFHLDTDFLVVAPSRAGFERTRLLQLAESEAEIHISSVAWYEFSAVREPRISLRSPARFSSETGSSPVPKTWRR